MTAERLADQDARDLAVERFDRPLVLEAGAGTGKTRALVARLATWLLGPGWEAAAAEIEAARERGRRVRDDDEAIAAATAESAVALTVTDAAAAELASRLGRLL
ncbi:MAG TPA: UvrD-helicase domain-containing protein, partial [Thermoanaerobaculia bacterium]|nr:UvrD-helicase domain-containing protein [Thermoanaerobaculia bacterium]